MTEIVAKQPHHHHHHPVQTPTTVSLETHQSERGGTANTTIAATTHHLHEMEVSTLKVIHNTDYYINTLNLQCFLNCVNLHF